MYAIQNIKTGKFVYGTDYRYSKPRQRTSHNQMLTYADYESANCDFRTRRCCKAYKIVDVEVRKVIEVKRVVEGSDSE
jgi:hypothetical protein